MIKEFRDFLFRGNIVELAVAFVVGVAFAALVNSLVDNLIMPIVAMIIGKPNFDDLTFTINDAVFRYGAFITDLIAFVAIAAAIFFFVVKPVQAMLARRQRFQDGRGDRNERDQVGDEGAVTEDGVVDRERQIVEAGLADDHRDDRHDQVVHERVDRGCRTRRPRRTRPRARRCSRNRKSLNSLITQPTVGCRFASTLSRRVAVLLAAGAAP